MIAALLGLPRWAHALMGAGALLAAFLIWDWFDDRAAVKAHEAQVGAKVQATASAAASDAHTAVTERSNEVEKANADARDAAARSDDPLRAGLDRLRAEKRPDQRPAARADNLRQ